ncbi:MAG: L,D-transpeptidase [Anaerolineae bacterium]|nr:L,D-transpeptidase [Anaerolineae bacterium]
MRKMIGFSLLIIGFSLIGFTPASAQETVCLDCLHEQLTAAGISAEAIAAYPAPAVTALAPDEELLYDRRYQRVQGAIEIFDAPHGSPTRTLDAGFNFVTTFAPEGEWTQINVGEWVRSEALTQVLPSRFTGVLLPDGELPYPMGWILIHVVPSRAPGAEPLDTDLPLMRYTLVNLYTNVEIDGWRWYQVGVDQWVHQTLIAKMIPVERPEGVDTRRWISVDLYEQVVIAYDGDLPVFATLISSGLAEWPTNEGVFNIYIRYDRTIMSGAAGRPDFYFLEEVPWTMYFDHDIGLHGTYWHDGFGYRHSHGCVNLSVTDSFWLYNWASVEFDFEVPNDTGAAVYVYSSGAYRDQTSET